MLNQFMHNGVIVPPKPAPRGLALTIRCESRALTPHQEEMAIAWARKIGTEYTQDSGFCKNFMRDFSAALGSSLRCPTMRLTLARPSKSSRSNARPKKR